MAKPRIEIYTDGWISIDGRPTKFHVAQEYEGTSLLQDNGKNAEPRFAKVNLPQVRYSLAHENPACGFGRSDFEADLLNIIQGEA